MKRKEKTKPERSIFKNEIDEYICNICGFATRSKDDIIKHLAKKEKYCIENCISKYPSITIKKYKKKITFMGR